MSHREKSIRERAYEIWEAEGRPEGREADHWQQASAELAEVEDHAAVAAAEQPAARRSPAGPKNAGTKPGAEGKTKTPAKTAGKRRPTGMPVNEDDVSPIDRDVAVLGAKPGGRKRTP